MEKKKREERKREKAREGERERAREGAETDRGINR